MNEITYCEETINIWIDNIKDKDITEEINDVKNSITNEELWLKGSDTSEEQSIHLENIANYKEYLHRLEELQNKKD